MAASSDSITTLDSRRQAVQSRLARVRRLMRWQLLLEGLSWAVAAAALILAVSFAIDLIARPERPVRMTLLILGVAMLAFIAIRRLYRPVTLKLDDLDLAELLERRQKGIGQRLANVLLLPKLMAEDPSASPAMIAASVQEDFAEVERTDLTRTFNHQRRRSAWLLMAGLAAIVAVFCLSNPAMANLWARRWFAGADLRWPQRTYLTVVGLGDSNVVQVPRGEAALFEVNAAPEFVQSGFAWRLNGRGRPLLIESPTQPKSSQPDSINLDLQLADGSHRRGVFTHFSAGQFRYELPPLTESAEASITGGDDWFGPIRIDPIDRPAIDKLTLHVRSPGSAETQTVAADNPELQLLFLPGTQLDIEFTTTESLSDAKVLVSGTDQTLNLTAVSDRPYRLSWELKDPITWEFQLLGKSGLHSKPYFLTIGILNDRAPRLTLRSSGVGRRVTPVARIPLHVRVLDDFGVSNLNVELEETRIVESKPVATTHQPIAEAFEPDPDGKLPTDVAREPELGLTEYSLTPGAMIRIRAKADDACVLGVQSSESRWLTFQVVSADELFYEILTRQREQRNRLGKILQSSKDQREDLARIASKPEVSQAVRVLQANTRQVWQIANQLTATHLEMTLNDVGTPPARELLEAGIIQPLRTLHDSGLSELRTKLESLANVMPIDEPAREETIAAQTVAIDEIQRIYDRMSQWESFVDVVNQLRHVISSQDQLRELTETTKKKQIDAVFDEE